MSSYTVGEMAEMVEARLLEVEAERDAARAEAETLRGALAVAWRMRWTQVETDDWCEAVDEFDRLVLEDPAFPRAALASSMAPARETAPEQKDPNHEATKETR